MPGLGPLAFAISIHGCERNVDLTQAPCPRLARSLVAGLRYLAVEEGIGKGWHMLLESRRNLLKLLAYLAPLASADHRFGLDDLQPHHLDGFEQALLAKYLSDSGRPYNILSNVIAVLRGAFAIEPQRFSPELAARIRYVARDSMPHLGDPLDAYPPAVFEAIKKAATSDARAILQRIQDGEARLARGDDPDLAGWANSSNILWYIARHGPLKSGHPKQWVMNNAGGLTFHNSLLHLTPADVIALLVLLICITGLEPECAKELRADCLINPSRGFVSIAYHKSRAHSRAAKTVRVSDGGALHHPGGLIRMVLRLTKNSRAVTGSTALWLHHGQKGTKASFGEHGIGMATWKMIQAWMSRHELDQLLDYNGEPIVLDLRRLRKSYKSQQYLKSSGVLADFVNGHTTDVAARHYADIGAHRELHEQAVEDGLREAHAIVLPAPRVLDDDGTRLDIAAAASPLPDQIAAQAMSGATDVFLASCTSFHDSPFAAKGKPCPAAIWGCLDCPNAVFTSRHLPQLLTFLAFIEGQREELSTTEWHQRYATAWDRIVNGIRNKFRTQQIETALAIAQGGNGELLLPPQFWRGLA